MLKQKPFQPWPVGFAGLAQQPARGFVHQVFRVGEVLARTAVGRIKKSATAGERHKRDQRRAPKPE